MCWGHISYQPSKFRECQTVELGFAILVNYSWNDPDSKLFPIREGRHFCWLCSLPCIPVSQHVHTHDKWSPWVLDIHSSKSESYLLLGEPVLRLTPSEVAALPQGCRLQKPWSPAWSQYCWLEHLLETEMSGPLPSLVTEWAFEAGSLGLDFSLCSGWFFDRFQTLYPRPVLTVTQAPWEPWERGRKMTAVF